MCSHVDSVFPGLSFACESATAHELSEHLERPLYTATQGQELRAQLGQRMDVIATFGGDGTVLHASSLFSEALNVPPLLAFSMGTLGFLGEWRFADYKRAFREMYMSGSRDSYDLANSSPTSTNSWGALVGQSMGSTRSSQVLRRRRLQVSIHDESGKVIERGSEPGNESGKMKKAMNEVIIHRGSDPHLAIVEVYVGGKLLTEAVADGMIVSTPTGSTAYSLSSGGSILHPLVPAVMLTPICPRSLSFRPVVLPASTPIVLKLSKKNRGREVEVSIDGQRWSRGVPCGLEVRISSEDLGGPEADWVGGVPCIVQADGGAHGVGNDGWVGGLNSLLKFNYPFGDET